NPATEFLHGAKVKGTAPHKTLQHPYFLRIAVTTEQTNIACDILAIFQLRADVRADEQVFSMIGRGYAVDDEFVVWLGDGCARPAFLLGIHGNGVSPEMKIKLIGHYLLRPV